MPKNKSLDITDVKDLTKILKGVESTDNKARKRHAWIAHNCLYENQKAYVKKEVQKIYPSTYSKFRIADILLTKKVVMKKAKAYRKDPKRDTGNSKENKELERIYDESNFNETMKELDRIVQLHKYGCIWTKHINPEEEGEDGKYHFQALSPFEFDLVRDEVTGEPLIFILSYPGRETTNGTRFSDGIEEVTSESQADTSAEVIHYSIWSKENFVKVRRTVISQGDSSAEVKVEIIVDPENKENENEIGRLPIVYVQKSSSVDYPLPSNLADQTINWNVAFSDYKTASAAQGHGVLLYYYPDGMKDKKKIIHTGMHTAIDCPQGKKKEDPGTDAKYINANPNLSDQLDGLKFEAVNILDDHGIKGGEALNKSTSAEFTSALDRIVSNADVEEIVVDHQTCYMKAEQEQFSVIRAHEDAKENRVFREESVLSIVYPKPTVMISDSETLDNIEKRQRLFIDFPWQRHQIMDPNLTDKQAQKRHKEIIEARKKDLEEMNGLFSQEDNDENEEEETEE